MERFQHAVDGNTTDYVFDWYIGTVEKSTPDFVGEIYDSLAVGPYSVTATSTITGCKSPIATEEILHEPKYPDFSVTTVPTVCREDSSEPATGFAALFMTNSVDTDSIIWRMRRRCYRHWSTCHRSGCWILRCHCHFIIGL